MTHPARSPQTTAITPSPTGARIVVRHITGRTWHAHPDGAGRGAAWGHALATLDHHAHAVSGTRPAYWIDRSELEKLEDACAALGVHIERVDEHATTAGAR